MPESPHVVIVSQPQEAGVPRHVLELVDGLRHSWRVTVACPRGSELWAGLAAMPEVARRPIAAVRRPALADLASLLRILPLVRRADVVHGHSSKAGFLARLAALLTGRTRRCVFTPHGWSWWAFTGWRSRLYLALERLAARWCRTVVTVSEYERDAALAAGVGRPGQYRVVRNGVSLERFAAEPCPQPGRVIMVGRFAPPKRHDVAIAALALLRERMPEATLDVVGDGPLREEVEAAVARHRLGGAVRLLGQREDVPALLAAASCLLLASDYEACPLTVLEGMAAGLPVVVTRFGGVEELVDEGHTGYIVAMDPHAIADALHGVLADPARARSMGEAARTVARQGFGRMRMVEQTAAVYAEICAGGCDAGPKD